MPINEMIKILLAFPTQVFFIPFVFIFCIMLIDLVFNFVDGMVQDIDFFDLDDATIPKFILPPVLAQIPLMIVLCVTFFIATVLSFYISQWQSSLSFLDSMSLPFEIISIPVVAFVSLHIASWVLKPLIPLFDRAKSFAEVNYIGLKGRVHTSKLNQQKGEIIVLSQGNEFLLNARNELEEELYYGEQVIIVSKETTKDGESYYIVSKV